MINIPPGWFSKKSNRDINLEFAKFEAERFRKKLALAEADNLNMRRELNIAVGERNETRADRVCKSTGCRIHTTLSSDRSAKCGSTQFHFLASPRAVLRSPIQGDRCSPSKCQNPTRSPPQPVGRTVARADEGVKLMTQQSQIAISPTVGAEILDAQTEAPDNWPQLTLAEIRRIEAAITRESPDMCGCGTCNWACQPAAAYGSIKAIMRDRGLVIVPLDPAKTLKSYSPENDHG